MKIATIACLIVSVLGSKLVRVENSEEPTWRCEKGEEAYLQPESESNVGRACTTHGIAVREEILSLCEAELDTENAQCCLPRYFLYEHSLFYPHNCVVATATAFKYHCCFSHAKMQAYIDKLPRVGPEHLTPRKNKEYRLVAIGAIATAFVFIMLLSYVLLTSL